MSEMSLDLDCSVCGQNATFRTEEPVQWQAFYDSWNSTHKHSAAELRSYYRAEMADVEDDDGD